METLKKHKFEDVSIVNAITVITLGTEPVNDEFTFITTKDDIYILVAEAKPEKCIECKSQVQTRSVVAGAHGKIYLFTYCNLCKAISSRPIEIDLTERAMKLVALEWKFIKEDKMHGATG
jgi:hypothetical protein